MAEFSEAVEAPERQEAYQTRGHNLSWHPTHPHYLAPFMIFLQFFLTWLLSLHYREECSFLVILNLHQQKFADSELTQRLVCVP